MLGQTVLRVSHLQARPDPTGVVHVKPWQQRVVVEVLEHWGRNLPPALRSNLSQETGVHPPATPVSGAAPRRAANDCGGRFLPVADCTSAPQAPQTWYPAPAQEEAASADQAVKPPSVDGFGTQVARGVCQKQV